MGPACQSADLSAKTSAKAEGGQWGGSVSAIPLARGRQNRKIFVSLIKKNFGGARIKKCLENFSVLLSGQASGNAPKESIASYGVNWAGLPPAGRQLKVAVRIFVKKNSSFAKATADKSSLAKTGELKLRKEENIARKRKLFKMKRKEGRKAGRKAGRLNAPNFWVG